MLWIVIIYGHLCVCKSFNMFWKVKLDGVKLSPIGFQAIWMNQHWKNSKESGEKQFMQFRLVF